MDRWKSDFINQLRQGKTPEYAARMAAGLPLVKVIDARDHDEEFAAAWDSLIEEEDYGDAKVSGRTVSPAALEALLWAQSTDEEAAAYFGLTVQQLMDRVKANAKLEQVYKTARLGGVAALKRAQFELGLSGNPVMLNHLGKNYAGQSDKMEVKQEVVHTIDTKDLARKMMFIMAQAGTDQLPAIDVEEAVMLPVPEEEEEIAMRDES